MTDIDRLRLMGVADPQGRLALQKFLATASADEIDQLNAVLNDTPLALLQFGKALESLRKEMEDLGLL